LNRKVGFSKKLLAVTENKIISIAVHENHGRSEKERIYFSKDGRRFAPPILTYLAPPKSGFKERNFKGVNEDS